MKKNLLTIIVIALLIVNIVLTSIMMISMMGTNKKTADLVSDIAAVLNLELGVEEEEEKVEIPMSQQFIWNLEGTMTIPLQSEVIYDVDGKVTGNKDHYIAFDVSFALDTKGKGYKEYGENIANYESIVKDAVTATVSKHTIEECRNDFDAIRDEILVAVQALFDKEFIYKVAINGIKYQ
jgi:flagellar FliL protein